VHHFLCWDGNICTLWRPPLKTWIQPLPDPDIKQKIPRGHEYQTMTVTASDSKTTQSGGDNRKIFPLGAALQVPQNFSFAPLKDKREIKWNKVLNRQNCDRNVISIKYIYFFCNDWLYQTSDRGLYIGKLTSYVPWLVPRLDWDRLSQSIPSGVS
jgi:hypothetical protein